MKDNNIDYTKSSWEGVFHDRTHCGGFRLAPVEVIATFKKHKNKRGIIVKASARWIKEPKTPYDLAEYEKSLIGRSMNLTTCIKIS